MFAGKTLLRQCLGKHKQFLIASSKISLRANITELHQWVLTRPEQIVWVHKIFEISWFYEYVHFAFLKDIMSGIKVYILKAYTWKRPLKYEKKKERKKIANSFNDAHKENVKKFFEFFFTPIYQLRSSLSSNVITDGSTFQEQR